MRRHLAIVALLVSAAGSAHADPARWHRVLIVTPRVETDVDAVLHARTAPKEEERVVVILPVVTDFIWDAVGWSAKRQRPDLRASARDGGVQLAVSWRF